MNDADSTADAAAATAARISPPVGRASRQHSSAALTGNSQTPAASAARVHAVAGAAPVSWHSSTVRA